MGAGGAVFYRVQQATPGRSGKKGTAAAGRAAAGRAAAGRAAAGRAAVGTADGRRLAQTEKHHHPEPFPAFHPKPLQRQVPFRTETNGSRARAELEEKLTNIQSLAQQTVRAEIEQHTDQDRSSAEEIAGLLAFSPHERVLNK